MQSLTTHLLYFAQTAVSTNSLPNTPASQGEVGTALTILFTVTGALALLVITLGGLRYILSRGDPSATAQAKDTIMYAVIGLVVSIAAYAIVNFVAKSTL
jgi:hypothetical protein